MNGGGAPSYGSKQAMSVRAPVRSAAPADADPHPGAHGVRTGRVEGVQQRGVRTVEADQDPGEGGGQGLSPARGVVPGPGGDGAGGCDLDESAQFLGGDGAVLGGRDMDPAVGAAHAEDDAFAQSGEEGFAQRQGGPSVGMRGRDRGRVTSGAVV